MQRKLQTRTIPPFGAGFFRSASRFARIGDGAPGGKAQSLLVAHDALASHLGSDTFPGLEIDVPRSVVIGTDVFDAFMAENHLAEIAFSDASDAEIADAFQRAKLPAEVSADLQVLVDEARGPLAVRSSSLLEDALYRPFAGVYETKMTPNNQPNGASRRQRLIEAIRLIYAATYFRAAKSYIRATDHDPSVEKMAVLIQEVAGAARHGRFYPDVSGVCRSYNFYPSGRARPEEGVVNLALGLGKTIVDGAMTWIYSPARPKAPPPFASVEELLRQTQTEFWAVNLAPPAARDPQAETEYLVKSDLSAAEADGTLSLVASTYDALSDRLTPGLGARGPRAINFAPLLELERFPLNRMVGALLRACEDAVGSAVEIEFALTLPASDRPCPARAALLQVRPLVVCSEQVEISPEEMRRDDVLLASTRVMGNGTDRAIRDVVYVKPTSFESRHTREIEQELERVNAPLSAERRRYLLLGFGRWGSCDPWLGIPVHWGQISGAGAIVESTLPNMCVEPSQGSHFFHNISSFRVNYFCVNHRSRPPVDWEWLENQQAEAETQFVRHVRLPRPLLMKVDGRTGRGAIWRAA